MAIDFSIVREAVPPLLDGLRVTALVSAIGIPIGIVAGIVQILFGGPSGTRSGVRPVPAAG